jgi:hypothetical protein
VRHTKEREPELVACILGSASQCTLGTLDARDLLSATFIDPQGSARHTPPSLAADSPQQRILVLAVEKGSRRKCSRFLELIGSLVVAVLADYTRCI